MGGQFISDGQPLVMEALRRYGIGTVNGPAPTRAVMPTSDGQGSFTLADVVTRQGGLLERLFEGSEEYGRLSIVHGTDPRRR